MSGGSYDYLCTKDVEELFNAERLIEQMADRLSGLGYANDAATETQQLLLNLRQARIRLETSRKRLEGVWHAVEWWDSCDSGEDSVKSALVKYRGGEPSPRSTPNDSHVGKTFP